MFPPNLPLDVCKWPGHTPEVYYRKTLSFLRSLRQKSALVSEGQEGHSCLVVGHTLVHVQMRTVRCKETPRLKNGIQ